MSDSMTTFNGIEDEETETGTEGFIEVGYNFDQRHSKSKQIYVTVEDEDDCRAGVLLTEKTALEVLHHLNELLGRPLSTPAYAAG